MTTCLHCGARRGVFADGLQIAETHAEGCRGALAEERYQWEREHPVKAFFLDVWESLRREFSLRLPENIALLRAAVLMVVADLSVRLLPTGLAVVVGIPAIILAFYFAARCLLLAWRRNDL